MNSANKCEQIYMYNLYSFNFVNIVTPFVMNLTVVDRFDI